MKQTAAVFRVQFALFKREKGMLVFYLLLIAATGIIVPLFYHNTESIISVSIAFPVMFLKPLLADSLAGERERKTLESLLSAPISGKYVVWGKALFGFLFSSVFFFLTVACLSITNWLIGYGKNMSAWQWVYTALLPLVNFAVISVAGVYASAKSADTRTANSRLSRIAYPFGLMLIISLAVVFQADRTTALVLCAAFVLICVCFLTFYALKISKMKQAVYFENVKIKKYRKSRYNVSMTAPKSQFAIVFGHEIRYTLTLKTLLFSFLFFCFTPAIVLLIFRYYTGEMNFDYTILLTALMIPRVPTNLIAYSIGGEKAYKTGESLLSTPLRVRPLFLAKSMIPVLVSAIMLLLSALLTLAGANFIGWLTGADTIYMYTAGHLMLLFPVGIMSSMMMVFITGVLSVNMKTPRQGLYASTAIGFAFIVPPLAIIYLTKSVLLWSAIYFAVLFLCNAICIKSISDRIERPMLMSKL